MIGFRNLPTAPTHANKTHTAVTAASPSSAIATGVGDGSDYVLNVICTADFNISFSADGTDTITNPADNSAFPQDTLLRFRLCKKNSHFKATPQANGTLTTWLDRA